MAIIHAFFFFFFRYVPSSPGRLVEDITEIMNKEKLNDSTVDYKPENNVSSGIAKVMHNPKRLSFENAGSSQIPKKAKKSLEVGWDSSTASDISYLIETPVSFITRDTFLRLIFATVDFSLFSLLYQSTPYNELFLLL